MRTLERTIHQGSQPVELRLRRTDDGRLEHVPTSERLTLVEQLVAFDIGRDDFLRDELVRDLHAVGTGRTSDPIHHGWDSVELEVGPVSSRIRSIESEDDGDWVDVPTRELHDALVALAELLAD